MQDICHFTGGDIDSSSTGDLRTATGSERTKQRILRRLLTNPGEYLFHPGYGAGLGKKVGEPVKPGEWIKLMLIQGGVSVSSAYIDAMTGMQESLHFNVTQ